MQTHKNKILLIDNEDSFTHNLKQIFEEAGAEVDIKLPKKVCVNAAMAYNGIVISPGPGVPSEMSGLISIIQRLAPKKPMFGVCLGMQAIAVSFGGNLYQTDKVLHGRKLEIEINNNKSGLLVGLDTKMNVGLYHSWAVEPNSLPDVFEVTAISSEKIIMAISHSQLPIFGVQFHPESIITEEGKKIAENFLSIIKEY
jgi:anthranilate synthase/aminodeoxychorismate synthase-like glutamine amidotransferase